MFPENVHVIEELSPDDRTLSAQKYRKHLRHIAQTAIWTTYIYFAVRLFITLTTPDRTWKMWAMLGIEGLFSRELFPNNEHRTVTDLVRHIPESPTPIVSRNEKTTTPDTPQEITKQRKPAQSRCVSYMLWRASGNYPGYSASSVWLGLPGFPVSSSASG